MESFQSYNINNTSFFSLKGKSMYGRVVNVLDGDSIIAIIPLFNNYYKFYIRLSGIDTCETKSKDPELRNIAMLAKRCLFKMITGNELHDDSKEEIIKSLDKEVYTVWLECLEFDKFGRLLANVSQTNTSELFSDVLIKNKLAYEYHGEKKLTEEEQLLLLGRTT